MRQRDLAKNFKTTEKPPTHGVFHREASNRFLKSASVSCLNEASRRPILIQPHGVTFRFQIKTMTNPDPRATFVSLLQVAIEQQQLTPAIREYKTGEIIFSEGSPGDGIYAVLEGRVHISAYVSQTSSHSLGEFTPGEFFGEMSTINVAPRSATATALQDSRLLFVSRDQVMELMESCPKLTFALLHAFSNRIRETNAHFVHQMLEAERLSMLGRFVRSIVHDLKNPLSIILLAGDAAASPSASPMLREQAKNRMHQQVDRLSRMLNELLRVSEGSTQHSVEPVNFAAYVAEIIEETREELESKKVRVELQSTVPDLDLPLNARRLNRVFYNIFGNATDIMPDGGVITRASIYCTGSGGAAPINGTAYGHE